MAVLFASAVFFVFMFLPRQTAAQGLFGTISGTVTDSSGAVVSGAAVKITNTNTNIVTALTTNRAGVYNATSLNPGVYKVEAAAAGFKTAIAKGVVLEVNADLKIDLTLPVGNASETVQVTAEMLQTQQSDLGQTVNEQQLDQLPTQSGTVGRSPYSLLFLTAGVSEQVGAGHQNDNVRINGDRPRDQDYVLDGTSVVYPVFGGQAINPSIDSIQEFRVEANSMSAEWGNTGGGVMIAVTKSGTNQFHGSAYEYNRNEHFDARNFFENPDQRKNPYNYNEFGGTIGGPIIRNKVFFFTDYQGIRQHGSSPSVGNIVPNQAFRSGDLSALCTAGFNGSGTCLDPQGQVYYPGTTNPVPYNQLAGQISQISQKFLAILPTSTIAGSAPGMNLLNFNSPSSQSFNRFNPRIDYNLTSSDHIFGTFHWDHDLSTAYDLIVGPAGAQNTRTAAYAAAVGWTHTFSSSLLNEFRWGYLHRVDNSEQFGQGSTSPSNFDLTGIPNCLSSVTNTAGGTKCGTPALSIAGFTGLLGGTVLYEPMGILHFSDNVSWLHGRHSLKMGTDLRRYAIDNYQPRDLVGNFSFLGGETGNAFADFLFGTMTQGDVQVQNVLVQVRAWTHSFFVQDDFRVNPKLTLNLGLRYQYDQSFREVHNGLAFFNPFAGQWVQFGVNAPATSFDPSWKQFGPRVGFAWNLLRDTVVRGGYGIMFPGAIGHGATGDSIAGPNLLATTPFPGGTNWSALPPITNPDPSAITAPIPVNGDVSFSHWAPRQQVPTYIQLWNFSLERQFGSNMIAQLSYVGNHGVHLPVNYAYNICQQTPESTAELGYGATTSPYCSPQAAQEAGLFSLIVTPGWWGLSTSNYNSLQAKFERRFGQGFSLVTNFTWSKLIDDSSSDWGGFWSLDVLGQDFYNRAAERSVSAGDVPLRLTIAPIVELPFGPGKKWANHGLASQVVGGWRVTSIYTVSDGYPFGITDNSFGFCNAAHVLEDRPNMIGNPLPAGFHQTFQHWFDTSAFDFSGTCPAPGLVDLTGPSDTKKAFGDAPRFFSNIRVPGVNDFDLSLQKDFAISEGGIRLTFRADFYNAFNHAQFFAPNSNPLASTFGTITQTAINNRTVQLGLHLHF